MLEFQLDKIKTILFSTNYLPKNKVFKIQFRHTYRVQWINYHLNYTKMKITDTSLYQIYSPKLDENILKNYRLNLFIRNCQ